MSNAAKLVMVDPGQFGIKAMSGEKKFYVRSLIDEISNVPTESGVKVKFFDKEYIIGDEAIPFKFEPCKQKIETKILTYYAVTNLVENGDKVNLMLGMPLQHWLDKERRARYHKYMLTSLAKINVLKGAQEHCKTFKIENLTIVPETIGHVYNNPTFKTRTVGVLDCGGCNFQGAIFKNMVPIKDSCFTLNEGANYFLNSLKHTVNSKFNLNYQDYQIQDLVENGSRHAQRIEIENEVDNEARRHLKKIIIECKARNWNLNDMEIILTGGGAGYFGRIINEILPNATISDNEIWDNVSGFGVIGEQMYGRAE